MTPTPEQELIIAEGKSPDNLLVSALAGAAKTTTLTLLAKRLPLVSTLCCAFNKKIADEMAKRMPGHIDCKTMNAIGHRAWTDKLGHKLFVDSGKVYDLTKAEYDALPRGKEKEFLGENMASVMRGVRLAKSSGYIPHKVGLGEALIEEEEFLDTLAPQIDCEPDDEYLAWVDKILTLSINEAFAGKIDFDDQIYMSTLFGASFPKYQIILVDEAQDLSPMNHQMLRKMFGGRLIAVGDPFQAIYGFRGAHMSSMEVLRDEFKMKELNLSVSFRCPRAVVERARWRAPHMQYPDWAEPGLVQGLQEWGADSVPDGAAIICRNNAPLFSTALNLIRAGRGIKLLGNDIGAGLVKILTKFGPESLPQATVLAKIKEWEDDQIAKARESRKASIRDRAACLRVFAEFGNNLGSAVAYAKHLFDASGPILLMSGHKSKGLEFDTVFHLDPFLIPSKWARRLAEETGDESQLNQEKNLRYVIETRSKKELFFINSEDFR